MITEAQKLKHARYVREWRKRNLAKHLEYRRAWYLRHREEILEQRRKKPITEEQHREKKKYRQTRYLQHREEILEQSRVWRKEHPNYDRERRKTDPDYVARKYIAHREWIRRNPEKAREYARRRHYRSRYGISPMLLVFLRMMFKGGCPLCGRRRTLVVDHDHRTGEVRGMLCDSCNSALGKLGDTAESVQRAADYLVGEKIW